MRDNNNMIPIERIVVGSAALYQYHHCYRHDCQEGLCP